MPAFGLLRLLCCCLAAAGLYAQSWRDGFDGGTLGADWRVQHSPALRSAARLERGRLVLPGAPGRYHFLERPLGIDGWDETPLVISVLLDPGRRPAGLPLVLALVWPDGQLVAVGGEAVGEDRSAPTAWWSDADGPGTRRDDSAAGSGPRHCRLTVTSRQVTAWISRDGVLWSMLVALPRDLRRLRGAPERLVCGRAAVAAPATPAASGQHPLLARDALRDPGREPGDDSQASLDALVLSNAADAAVGDQPGWRREATWDDTLRTWNGPERLRGWSLLLPAEGRLPPMQPPLPEGGTPAWKPWPDPDESWAGVIDLSHLVGKRDALTALAAVVMTGGAAGGEAVLAYDGSRAIEWFLNGWPVGTRVASDRERVIPGLHELRLLLAPGDNLLAARVEGHKNRCRLQHGLRRGGDDDRLNALRRLCTDFPDDAGHLAQARREIAGLHEQAGRLHRAAEAWRELASAEPAAAAEVARARLRLYGLLANADGQAGALIELATALPAGARGTGLAQSLLSGTANAAARSADDRLIAATTPAGHPPLIAALAAVADDAGDRARCLRRLRELAGLGVAEAGFAAADMRLADLRADATGDHAGALAAALGDAELALTALAADTTPAGRAAHAAAAPLIAAARAAPALVAAARLDAAARSAGLARHAAGRVLIEAISALSPPAVPPPGAKDRRLLERARQVASTLPGLGGAGERHLRTCAGLIAVLDQCADRPADLLDALAQAALAACAEPHPGGWAVVEALVRAPGPTVWRLRLAEQAVARCTLPDALPLAAAVVAQAQALAGRQALPDRARLIPELLRSWARQLESAGDVAAALLTLRGALGDDPEPADRHLAVVRWDCAELERRLGEVDAALARYRQLVATRWLDSRLRDDAGARISELLPLAGSGADPGYAGEGLTLLDTAERAASGGDVERAVQLAQRASEEHGRTLVRVADERFAALADVATARIKAWGVPALIAYRQQYDAAALAALRLTVGHPVASEAQRRELARIADTWRLASPAAAALRRLASDAWDRGLDLAAAGARTRLITHHPDRDRACLDLAAIAAACARAGDRARALAALADIERLGAGGTVAVAGRTWAVADYVAAQRQRLDRPTAVPASSGTPDAAWRRSGAQARPANPGAGPRWSARFGAAPIDLAPVTWVQPRATGLPVAVHAVADAATVVFHTGEEIYALRVGDGAPRWRTHRLLQHFFLRNDRDRRFDGIAEWRPALDRGLVFCVLRSLGPREVLTNAVRALRVSDGETAWSSEQHPALSALDIAAAPTAADGRLYLLARDDAQADIVALAVDGGTGAVRWRTPLISAGGDIRTLGRDKRDTAGIRVGDCLGAPTLADGVLYFAGGGGVVAALDAESGRLLWLVTYPRAAFADSPSQLQSRSPDETMARTTTRLALRAPPRVLVAGNRLLLLPRDSSALLCLRRDDGALLWRRDGIDARELVGIAGGGDEALALCAGANVEALRISDGGRAWRWLATPAVGELHGGGVLGGTTLADSRLLIGAGNGLLRLRAADGASESLTPWTSLGSDRPLGNLLALPDGLIGFRREGDRVVRLGTQAGGGAEVDLERLLK